MKNSPYTVYSFPQLKFIHSQLESSHFITVSLYFHCNAPLQVDVSCKSLQPTSSCDVSFAIICTEVIEKSTFMFLSSCQRIRIKQLTLLSQQLTTMRAIFILLLLKGVSTYSLLYISTNSLERTNKPGPSSSTWLWEKRRLFT